MSKIFQSLTLSRGAIELLSSAMIEPEWYPNFFVPQEQGLKRVAIEQDLFIVTEDTDLDDLFFVVDLNMFDGQDPEVVAEIFARAIRIAGKTFEKRGAIPRSWAPFHRDSLLSIYAYSAANPAGARLHFDQNALGSGNLYAFLLTSETVDFLDIEMDRKLFQRATNSIADALVADIAEKADIDVGQYGVLLSEPLDHMFATSGLLKEWIENKLNPEQLNFVEKSHLEPIRLRGNAGTGKTQAMAVKCLRDLYMDADEGGDKTFAFLTHSAGLAHDVLRTMLHAMDPTERWAKLKTDEGQPKLWIGTLYEMAEEKLGYQRKGLEPLSLDGREGRFLQETLVEDALADLRRDPQTKLERFQASKVLGPQLDCEEISEHLVAAILNEFACSLDAENVRRGNDAAERYLKGRRHNWQMELPEVEDRELLLTLYEAYRLKLRDNRVLSMDQLVADFVRYLGTHEWDQLREEHGFDVIFVDEYHYFNRLETVTFQNLFKPRAAHHGRLPVFMAYDLKQSTTDASIGGGIQRFKNPGVGESSSVDLERVYRSTPQIGAFLADLDASFPTLDLEGEYATYNAVSQREAGDIPGMLSFDTNQDLIDGVTSRAQKLAKVTEGKGREVAILCTNESLFDIYRKAGRVRDRIVAIDSREDLKELRYTKSRCIFSMPEYVAGLQFDTVFLIHLDSADVSDEEQSLYQWRQHISRAYLGATRAKNKLYIVCSKERGGPSPAVIQPLKNGTLVQLE